LSDVQDHYDIPAMDTGHPHNLSLAEVERRHITAVLDHCGSNISRAAEILQIGRTTLYSKLNEYGLRK
jgi:two-component system, NtrC family, response regulator